MSNNSHIITFGCTLYITIDPSQYIIMGSHRGFEIYIRYKFLSISKYLEAFIQNILVTHFAYCLFDDIIIIVLWGKNQTGRQIN